MIVKLNTSTYLGFMRLEFGIVSPDSRIIGPNGKSFTSATVSHKNRYVTGLVVGLYISCSPIWGLIVVHI